MCDRPLFLTFLQSLHLSLEFTESPICILCPFEEGVILLEASLQEFVLLICTRQLAIMCQEVNWHFDVDKEFCQVGPIPIKFTHHVSSDSVVPCALRLCLALVALDPGLVIRAHPSRCSKKKLSTQKADISQALPFPVVLDVSEQPVENRVNCILVSGHKRFLETPTPKDGK